MEVHFMRFFAGELRKIIGADAESPMFDARFPGRVCIGRLSRLMIAKLEFAEQGTRGKYEAIKATVINRYEGAIDSNEFLFADMLGRKDAGNPNFTSGIIPYVWENEGKAEWHIYEPTDADYRMIAVNVNIYLEAFCDVPEVSTHIAERKA
jgi:hypothetical protein